MKILVTGGCGYIGSHTIVELLTNGHEVICVDNLCNSSKDILDQVSILGGGLKIMFYEEDLRDYEGMEDIFDEHRDIDCVIHFAGVKAVGESVQNPLKYYDNNVKGTMNLLALMKRYLIPKIIFSSSACVYGTPEHLPVKPSHPTKPENPYGNTKLAAENMITDFVNSDPVKKSAVLLRYFNPCGAHESGKIGESPVGMGDNLFPRIGNVIAGRLEKIGIFGDNYPTDDRTAIRDYIHVVDLAKGHIAALNSGFKQGKSMIYNLGTGKGYSVKKVIAEFEKQLGEEIPKTVEPRREGDIPELYADVNLANRKLDWSAELGLSEMVKSTLRYIKKSRE